MIEVALELLAALFEVLLTIAEPLARFFIGIASIDQSLSESSRLGESPLAREGRRDWRNCGLGCLLLLLLGGLATGLGWWFCS